MDVEPGSGQTDLRDYLQVVKTRKRSILLIVLLVVGAALGVSYLQTPLYRSEARVLLEADPSVSLALDVSTQVEVVASDPIAELVKDDLGIETDTAPLLGGLDVKLVPDTRVLEISYVSTDPEAAQRAAASFASSYIDYRLEEAISRTALQQEAAQERVDEVAEELAELERRLAVAEGSRDETLSNTLEIERNALIARLGVLQQRLADVAADPSTMFEASVIEAARVPGVPFAPSHIRNGALALFLGLALGIGLAFLRERLQDRLRDRDDIERALGVPVLATIPRYRPLKGGGGMPIAIAQPGGGAAEVYRSLRANVQFIAARQGIKSILITSAAAGEGKTVMTANLGAVLAHAGHRVILVSADLRRPMLENSFGMLPPSQGLSTWLAGPEEDPWELIQDPGITNLRIVPSGPRPPNPAELLSSPKMRNLISMLEENSDLVLFDSPPVLAVADGPVIGRHTGGAVLVVDGNSTHRSAVVRAKEELERTGGVLIGAVLNSVDPSKTPYYYAGDYQMTSAGTKNRETPTSPAPEQEKPPVDIDK
ncbi:MAG: polysaccharide biosynthesis tyrosine autokinase [Actinomycetota bacterium]